jgi:hypothetical protein
VFKNVASQRVYVFAFDSTTNLPKTGDGAQITAYIAKDYATTVTQLTDTSATEVDNANAKGLYAFDISQTETNADAILVTGKSTTSNIVVIGAPAMIYTLPNNFTTTSIDSNGRLDIIKVNGTSQTAGDIYSKVSALTFTVANQVDVNVKDWAGTAVSTPATAGIPEVNVKNINNVAAATPGASGGILISGSNAGTTTFGALTVTGVSTLTGNLVLSDGFTVSAPSTGNRAGITVTGNGTGAGLSITSGNGATANAVDFIAASTTGNGLKATGIGASSLESCGIRALAAGTGGQGIRATGAGTGHGFQASGGTTGNGLNFNGGATSGDGISITTTSGHGINISNVHGTSMHGILSQGGDAGTSDGIKAVAGTGGVDIRGNITGNVTGTITTATNVTTVNGLAAGVVTASSIAADAITAAKIANAAIDAATFAADVPSLAMRTGTAVAGGATTITLDAGASGTNSFYNSTLIMLTGGTGAGQSRFITAYVGATQVATVAAWVTNPDSSTTFAILPFDAVVASVASLSSAGNNAVADALLDRADAIETGITPRGAWRIGVAADAGKTDGMASAGTAHLRNVADTKNRVTATTDGTGNRTATSVDTT